MEIIRFQEFIAEDIKSFAHKQKRIIGGKSAGEEIETLSDSQKSKLTDLWSKDKNEAARYLRSIIIKEKNSQFGLGLALAVAGSAMIYKAANATPEPEPIEPEPIEPPPPTPQPGEDYVVQKGDSWWRIAQDNLPSGASKQDILAYTRQLASDNGATHLFSGKSGAGGLEPNTWYDFSGNAVSKSVLSAEDRLVPGETITINPFK